MIKIKNKNTYSDFSDSYNLVISDKPTKPKIISLVYDDITEVLNIKWTLVSNGGSILSNIEVSIFPLDSNGVPTGVSRRKYSLSSVNQNEFNLSGFSYYKYLKEKKSLGKN